MAYLDLDRWIADPGTESRGLDAIGNDFDSESQPGNSRFDRGT